MAEILVAIVVVAVGLLALSGSSAAVARMLGTARQAARATAVAERRLEDLRRQARSTDPPCLALAAGSATAGGMSERWEVVPGTGAILLRVMVTRQTSRGPRVDTLATAVQCG